jgi:hypothetical protein
LSLKRRFYDFASQNIPGGQPTSLPNDPVRPSSPDLPKLILYRKSDAAKALDRALAGYDKQVFFVYDSFLKREGVLDEVARLGWTVREPLEARANDSEKTIFKVDCPEDWLDFHKYYFYECQGIEVKSLMIDLSSKIFDFYPGADSMIVFNIKTILLRAVSHITVLFECDNDIIIDPHDSNNKSDPICQSLKEWMDGFCQIEDTQ